MVAGLVALCAATLGSSVSSAATNCGGGVRAVVVDCNKAKLIAKGYAKTRNNSIQGYQCSGRRAGSSIKGRCTLDNKAVIFSV